jgi:hypothetical protein
MPSGFTTRTDKPLSEHAKGELARLEIQPEPTSTINPGVVARLLRGGYIRIEHFRSPYQKSGNKAAHAVLTDAGRAYLRDAT